MVQKTLAANAGIATGGGRVMAARLTGETVAISSKGGAVVVQSLYAKKGHIYSGSGSVRIGTVHALSGGGSGGDNEAMIGVQSAGGSVELLGVEGSVSVGSDGGAVELQLYEGASDVVVDSGKGDIICYVPAKKSFSRSPPGEVASPQAASLSSQSRAARADTSSAVESILMGGGSQGGSGEGATSPRRPRNLCLQAPGGVHVAGSLLNDCVGVRMRFAHDEDAAPTLVLGCMSHPPSDKIGRDGVAESIRAAQKRAELVLIVSKGDQGVISLQERDWIERQHSLSP